MAQAQVEPLTKANLGSGVLANKATIAVSSQAERLISLVNADDSVKSEVPAETILDRQTSQEYRLIIELSKQYGLSSDLALQIAWCESHLAHYEADSTQVKRGRLNSADVGVFQINEKYHLAKSRELGFDIEQLRDNIEYAMWLMKNEGSQHWFWSHACWGAV